MNSTLEVAGGSWARWLSGRGDWRVRRRSEGTRGRRVWEQPLYRRGVRRVL